MYLSLEKRTIRLGLFCYKTENSIFHIVNIVVVSLRPLHTVQPTLPVPTTLSLLEMAKRVPVLPLGINLFQFLHCFNIRRKMLSFPPSRWSLYKTYKMGWNHVSNRISISCTRFFTRFFSIFIQFQNSDVKLAPQGGDGDEFWISCYWLASVLVAENWFKIQRHLRQVPSCGVNVTNEWFMNILWKQSWNKKSEEFDFKKYFASLWYSMTTTILKKARTQLLILL